MVFYLRSRYDFSSYYLLNCSAIFLDLSSDEFADIFNLIKKTTIISDIVYQPKETLFLKYIANDVLVSGAKFNYKTKEHFVKESVDGVSAVEYNISQNERISVAKEMDFNTTDRYFCGLVCVSTSVNVFFVGDLLFLYGMFCWWCSSLVECL